MNSSPFLLKIHRCKEENYFFVEPKTEANNVENKNK